MIKVIKEIIYTSAFLLALAAFTAGFSDLILPYRDGYGALWDSYVEEEKDSVDMLFLGSSLVYCDVIPAVIYEETESSAYVMAAPQLTMSQTYFYLRHCLKTQSPSIIFIESAGLLFPKYMEYSRINIGYMPFSLNRLGATFLAAEKEEWLGLMFPPYLYGSLWEDAFDIEKELGKKFLFDPLGGYTYLNETVSQDKNTERNLFEFENSDLENNAKYLEKIIDLCNKNNIRLIFYSSPMYKPFEARQYELIEETLNKYNAEYIDFNKDQKVFDFNREEDYYDIFHLNIRGAVKFSREVARITNDYEYNKKPHNTEVWSKRTDYLETIKSPK